MTSHSSSHITLHSPSSSISRAGRWRFALTAAALATASVAGAALYSSLEYMTPITAFTYYPAPTPLEITAALHRVNLDVHALTAAGLSANAVTALVDDAQAHLVAHSSSLPLADVAFNEARAECDRLERLIQSGLHTENDPAAFTAAGAAFTQAQTDRQEVLNDLIAAATADLTVETKALLATIRGNSDWEPPVAYRVIERTQAQWVQLREALAQERIALANDEPLEPQTAAYLADIRANPAVANALANLQTNLAPNSNAWNNALQE